MPEDLVARARKSGTPLVDGNTATFVWQGKDAPDLMGDFNDWEAEEALPLKKVSPGVWSVSLELPPDTYMEYAFTRGNQRVEDPLNPRSIWNGIEDYNHYFYMPEGVATPLAKRQANVPHGKVTPVTFDTDELAATPRRTAYLYQPPAKGPYPLVFVYDGRDYLRRAHLANIVDNLLAQDRIRPIALAMVANGGRKARSVEYMCSEATLALLLAKVLPVAQKRLELIDIQANPGSYGVLGASLGGLMALYAGLRFPQVFGKVLSQSGAFSLFEQGSIVYDLVNCRERLPLDIWMDAGKYEWLLGTNQRMHELLKTKANKVEYREYNGGHNYTSWQNEVWRGLEYLFGKEDGKP